MATKKKKTKKAPRKALPPRYEPGMKLDLVAVGLPEMWLKKLRRLARAKKRSLADLIRAAVAPLVV